MAKPVLKWAGGKSKIIPDIVKEMKTRPLGRRWTVKKSQDDKRYIEPFVGGAGAFLGLKRHGMIQAGKDVEILLADINGVLVKTLQLT